MIQTPKMGPCTLTVGSAVLVAVVVAGIALFLPLLPTRSVMTENLSDSYDFVIVGAGSAGSVLASRLSEDPDASVLLLEAGGHYTEDERFHVPGKFFELLKDTSDWGFWTEPQKFSSFGSPKRMSYWPRGRVLGGSSINNGMQYVRGFASDFDEWEKLGCEGWGYDDVLPYFLKSEDLRIDEFVDSASHNVGGPLVVSTHSVSPIDDKLLVAGVEAGYKITDNNAEEAEGFNRIQLNIRDGVRSSAGFEFISRAYGRPNLHVAVNSLVSRIAIKDKKATGVYVIKNNRKSFIAAKREVIVSAGVINTPQLLMLSGIGPKAHLAELGIQVLADLPVGENLQDHLMLIMYSKINTSDGMTPAKRNSWMTRLEYSLFRTGTMASSGLQGNAFFCSKKIKEERCVLDIQFVFSSLLFCRHYMMFDTDVKEEIFPKDENEEGFITAVLNDDTRSVGTLRLRSNDLFDHPVIDPNYLADSRDMDVMVAGIRIWERFLETPTMKKIGASTDQMRFSFCSQHEFRSDDYWACVVRHVAITAHHPTGTCKMGSVEDGRAVLDPQLRVKGIKGLRVVDGSVMPNVITGNTNAATIMIAEKAADMIRGKDTVSHLKDKTSKGAK